MSGLQQSGRMKHKSTYHYKSKVLVSFKFDLRRTRKFQISVHCGTTCSVNEEKEKEKKKKRKKKEKEKDTYIKRRRKKEHIN
jgi:hypothetical protein